MDPIIRAQTDQLSQAGAAETSPITANLNDQGTSIPPKDPLDDSSHLEGSVDSVDPPVAPVPPAAAKVDYTMAISICPPARQAEFEATLSSEGPFTQHAAIILAAELLTVETTMASSTL